MTIDRILIANRGEIAIRIARAAADLGIETVGVYPTDDAGSLHVARVDEAVQLEGRGGRAYLDIEQLVAVARDHGCDAVHPGYGFLSENAELSRRCAQEGIRFIGASPELLELLGDKAAARRVAEEAGTPIVRGTNEACTLEQVRDFFDELGDGAAIMIKALAGGGGRGMRRVTDRADLDAAYAQCRDEAALAFGSPDVYVEQLILGARHIEVQVVGDGTGAVAHAWERECTLQRRNQKLLEIAPSPTLDESTRQPIIEAALGLAAAVRYQGVGTFEFLVDATDPTRFWFMEINPRIQVEHTVTEEITGLDLVGLQIALADGRSIASLGLDAPPPMSGCAIQARVNLESMLPDGSTRPASGVVTAYDAPGGHGIRVDDALYTGYRVTPNYDSLGAKLIVHGSDYPTAIAKMYRSLRELRLEGVESNRTVLMNLVSRPEVIANDVTTEFIEARLGDLIAAGSHTALHVETGEQVADDVPRHAPVPDGHHAVVVPTGGTLVRIEVAVGDEVRAGQAVAWVEAMKMEFGIEVARAGVVTELRVPEVGEIVDAGQVVAVVRIGEIGDDDRGGPGQIDLDSIRPDLAEVFDRHERTLDAARPEAVERRHASGKRMARENIDDLLDAGSFNEYGAMAIAAQRAKHPVEKLIDISPADGIILGTGTINADLFGTDASRCAVMAYDYTVMGGSQGFMSHKKTDRLLHVVNQLQLPLVMFAEGGGGRPSDTDFPAVAALDLHTWTQLGRLSGVVPTVGIAAGPCFAGNVALFGLCDLTIATPAASIGMAGPAMVEGGGLGRFHYEEIGPVSFQGPNGVVDLVVADEAEAAAATKRYLSYFQGDLPDWDEHDQRLLRHIIPENRKRIYDVRELIDLVADVDSVLELRREFAPSAITALARLEGRPVGLIANDPRYLGGAIDAAAGDKFARFIQLCDAHGLPIVVLCDTPGFMVGPEAEREGTVRHVARMFLAAAHARVPIVTVVVRKAYGLGAMAMAAGGFGNAILSAAWPSGEFGSMGIEGAVRIAARRELEAIDEPDERLARFEELVAAEYERGKALNVASFLEIDAVIDPAETRPWVTRALRAAPRDLGRSGRFVDTW